MKTAWAVAIALVVVRAGCKGTVTGPRDGGAGGAVVCEPGGGPLPCPVPTDACAPSACVDGGACLQGDGCGNLMSCCDAG